MAPVIIYDAHFCQNILYFTQRQVGGGTFHDDSFAIRLAV